MSLEKEEWSKKTKRAKDAVNLEVDLIARYLKALDSVVKGPKPSKVSIKKLKKLGF